MLLRVASQPRGDFVVKGNKAMKEASRLYIRPKDWSYEEYKRVIRTMCEHLGVSFTYDDNKLRPKYEEMIAKKNANKEKQASAKQNHPKRNPRPKGDS